jgi:non-ribosomal peptide synthase protein (TIGR01720 family)
VIYPEQQSGDLSIIDVIEDNRVDIIKLTPAHLSIVQSLDLSSSRIHKMIVGGDAFKTELASKISRFYGANIELYNEYGPTEATVACAVHCYHPDADHGITVPIGQPILGAAIYLLDKKLNQVPQGVAGDLYIAGAGLAKGYLGQPELTSQRFIQHPNVPNQRLYCSGDRARYSHKGELEYLGREDQQLKINGVRVELGEIEAALLNVAGVTDAAVELSRHVQNRSAELHTLHCKVCGLEASHPSAQLDGENLCRICRIYEQQKEAAQAYFRDFMQLESWITRIRQQSGVKQNAIMLLSGGKDSSYALCKLVDMGLNPIVFTLDNGFISQGAKANVQRLVERLGLELVVGETPYMNEIFVDSLSRFSNVCNGCFKTIYTMATNLARERGIKVICTGLSRGQIFETRVAHLFQQGCFDSTDIDRRIIDARKAYHRTRDLIANRLDVKVFEDDAVFEDIQYLDFYRFVDVTLAEMYQYLNNIAPWIRPSDTGRSTNCLINDAGIFVHKKERGFHNYSLPYSWDVRLGHKERDAALEELDDEIDEQKVNDILNEIGYQVEDFKLDLMPRDTLIAYYVAPAEILKNTLQKQLAQCLLSETIPSQFVWMAKLPLTANGKIDRKALPQPRESRREVQVDYRAPRSPTENLFASLWQQILGVEEVGIDDNFFDLGGDSIVNIQIVSAARKQDIEVSPQQIFDYPTIRALAKVAGKVTQSKAEQGEVSAAIALLPSQQKYFSAQPLTPARFNQHLVLSYQGSLTIDILRNAFSRLLAHHDGLRTAFSRIEQDWLPRILPADQAHVISTELDLRQRSAAQQRGDVSEHMQLMSDSLDIQSAQLLAFAHILTAADQPNQLAIMIHHLVVDGVSWWVLLQDLELLLAAGSDPQNTALPAKTSSLVQWCESLTSYRSSSRYLRDMTHWQGIDEVDGTLFSCTEGHSPAIYNTLNQSFSKALTRQLTAQIPASLGVQSQELLITALVNTLLPYVQGNVLKLDIEGHGRESFSKDCDVTRTVGWFTSIFPILINKASLQAPHQNLKVIKQSLRSAPLHGAAYGISRYFSNPENDLPKHPSQVLFNFMGVWERTLDQKSPFAFITPLCASHGHTQHDYALQVNAMVFDDQLTLSWIYQSGLVDSVLSQRLLDAYAQSFESLISACSSNQENAFTPTDFPTADIKQDDIDDIFAEFGED